MRLLFVDSQRRQTGSVLVRAVKALQQTRNEEIGRTRLKKGDGGRLPRVIARVGCSSKEKYNVKDGYMEENIYGSENKQGFHHSQQQTICENVSPTLHCSTTIKHPTR